MARGPHARRKQLGRQHKRGAVRPEVGEEKGTVENSKQFSVAILKVIVLDSYDHHEDGHHEEAEKLDFETTEFFDEEDSEPVTGEGSAQGDHEHGTCCFEHFSQSVDLKVLLDQTDRRENVFLG
ncbi:LOW QUALITY PROTEIN: hypothetical protein TorRG33x02_072620 [Trema orientale]|uniref:Uncharacterized protein n=1 Tax=Trema orientale TaxID=63057 RepID=A0A2P5FGG8_TREOI|nr:LOW QUALITY PROTEIN: hypothetical protein TorRG33x02_072620 [Trema orientale]